MELEEIKLGDSCLSYRFGTTIDEKLNSLVLSAYDALNHHPLLKKLGAISLVPTFTSLSIYFDPYQQAKKGREKRIRRLIVQSIQHDFGKICEKGRKKHSIPVHYNGVDLERVAQLNHLSIEEVISIHTGSTYRVAMIGFKPYFPYLIGLDARLETPRLDSPRTRIPAGSVAIGGAQTGIYPEESPGGWNLIGVTDPELLKALKPGDTLQFVRSK